jgi:hypothetical protein
MFSCIRIDFIFVCIVGVHHPSLAPERTTLTTQCPDVRGQITRASASERADSIMLSLHAGVHVPALTLCLNE